MPRRRVALPPSVVPLAQEAGRPLRWRLHQGFKAAILDGRLEPGARLPSTRTLAGALGISRSTVVEAFDQLAAEGFVERRDRSGTFVSRRILPPPATGPSAAERRGDGRRRAAHRVQAPSGLLEGRPVGAGPPAFRPCEPDPALFPHALWARMVARHARAPERAGASADPAGLPRLRQALAAHLTLSRGVTAAPEQIVITSGARQALHLCAHTLLDPGDRVWHEDPGYPDARAAFALAGAHVVPVPVDHEGIDVEAGTRRAPHARAAYVTPSHQFPAGVVMSLERRLRLLDWAARTGAWILEDDYDSEFCHDDRPLPALQGLDRHQAVVYAGTLNKITHPGLRIGYLVTPPAVAGAFAATTAIMSVTPPYAVQAAAADFVAEGHLAQHITRTRAAYRERRHLLLAELDRHAGDHVRLGPAPTGMHVLAALRGAPAEEVAAYGARRGLELRALSGYAQEAVPEEALVIGYTHLPPERIRAAVRDLARILSDVGKGRPRRPTRPGPER